MSETWFISDSHFGHKSIIEYEHIHRPFPNVEEMNEAMVDRWNKVVGKYDKVFHLGDFCFGRNNIAIAGRLNGQKRLVLGNHDIYGAAEYLKYFRSVHGAVHWNRCILTHIPVHSIQLAHRFFINVHGHLHSNKINDLVYFNVSVEQNNLTPINACVILERLKELDRL